MKYIKTAELREDLLSKIRHQDNVLEIEHALDDYVNDIMSNYEEDAKKLDEACVKHDVDISAVNKHLLIQVAQLVKIRNTYDLAGQKQDVERASEQLRKILSL